MEEDRWRRVIDRLPVAVATTHGPDHLLREVNLAFCRLAGRDRDALLDQPFATAVERMKDGNMVAELDHVYRTGRMLTLQDRALKPRGSDPTYYNIELSRLGDGLLLFATETTERVRDASELMQVNERLLISGLREQEYAQRAALDSAQMNALLENLTAGAVVLDGNGEVVLLNAAARDILGVTLEPGQPLALTLTQPDGSPLPADDSPFRRLLRGRPCVDEEVAVLRADGETRLIAVSGSAVRGPDKRFSSAIGVFRDVTELRKLERMRADQIALISHDLRSPLSVVTLFSQMLEQFLAQKGLGDEASSAARIVKNAKHMAAMIEDLLDVGRLEAGPLDLRREPTDVRELVTDLCDRVTAAKERERLHIEASDTSPTVPADHMRVERALSNLIVNALKYSPPESPVVVRIDDTDREVVVSVHDEGPGISAEELPHLFDRYYRVRTGKKTEGFGLGLYITRLIAEAHGGRVWAESPTDQGHGSTFSLALPRQPS